MVQYAAGKLPSRKLVSIWNLPELRSIEVLADELRMGAVSTYTDIREQEVIAREFPMLARAACWTGGIANQNRGTIGGNLANASPAADSSPALFAYAAEIELISARGTRRIPYEEFHLGYKKTALAVDELIRVIHLPKRFTNSFRYARKVGTRNAQAISKICVATTGKLRQGRVEEIRIGMGSVAPAPLRLVSTERALLGTALNDATIAEARKALLSEAAPIDDIRSTASYRKLIAGNLLEELLRDFASWETRR